MRQALDRLRDCQVPTEVSVVVCEQSKHGEQTETGCKHDFRTQQSSRDPAAGWQCCSVSLVNGVQSKELEWVVARAQKDVGSGRNSAGCDKSERACTRLDVGSCFHEREFVASNFYRRERRVLAEERSELKGFTEREILMRRVLEVVQYDLSQKFEIQCFCPECRDLWAVEDLTSFRL